MAEADIEIAVEAASEEAIQGIEDTEEALNDAGDSMEETAGDMQDMQRKMSGLAKTLVAGLAVSAAGLLSRVPVLGEAFAGLSSIISAVAFQMDQVLRPVLEPVGAFFFWLSEQIFEAEGAMGALIGIGATLASVIALVGSVVLTGIAILSKLGVISLTLTGALAAVKGALLVVASAISLPLVAAGLLIAGIALLAWHFRDELVGAAMFAVDKLIDFADWILQLPNTLADVASAIGDWASNVAGKISDLVTDIAGFFVGLANRAAEWGRALLERFVQGIKDAASGLGGFVGDAVGGLTGDVGAAVDVAVGGATDVIGNVTGGGGGGGSRSFNADRGGQPPTVRMDGRRLTQQDSRYRRDGTASRARNG